MYRPNDFQQNDSAVQADFILKHPFALLISQGGDGAPAGVHLPLELTMDDGWVLWGHVAKANPIWQSWPGAADSLAVFTGPHAYISPTWYDHPNVPTWNYTTAHLYGRPEILTDEALILGLLNRSVARFEQPNSPYQFERLPEAKRAALLKGVTAFRMPVTRVEVAFKLSQNRDQPNWENVTAQLEQSARHEDRETAAFMRRFPKS